MIDRMKRILFGLFILVLILLAVNGVGYIEEGMLTDKS